MKKLTEEERKAKKAERDRRYYERHKEQVKHSARQWVADNRERKLEHSRQYYQNNKEKMLEQSKEWSTVNRDRHNETERIRQRANYVMLRMLKAARGRAQSKGVPFDLTPDDITIPDVCPVLNIPLEVAAGKATDGSPSLDRLIPELGYVVGNVRVISNRANRIKYNATLEELQAVVRYLEESLSE